MPFETYGISLLVPLAALIIYVFFIPSKTPRQSQAQARYRAKLEQYGRCQALYFDYLSKNPGFRDSRKAMEIEKRLQELRGEVSRLCREYENS